MSRKLSLALFWTMTAFFGCFFVYPIWSVLREAFIEPGTNGGFTFDYVAEVFMNALYREGLLNSFQIAIWSTLLSLVIALPLAALHVRYAFPGRGLLNSMVLLPMVLPPFVGAIGVKAMLGQAGALNAFLISLGLMDAADPVNWLGDGRMLGVVIMEALHLYPILYLNTAAALANLDPALEEAAANLGCMGWRRFQRITLPLILPGVFAGGDVAHGPRTAVEAIRSGKIAAASIDAWLRGAAMDPIVGKPQRRDDVIPLKVVARERSHLHRAEMPEKEVGERLGDGNYAKIEQGLTDAMAKNEAARCLRCDVCIGCGLCQLACSEMGIEALRMADTAAGRLAYFDFTRPADLCIGCGACMQVCPTGAIRIEDDEDTAVRRTIITEAAHARRTMSIERRAARLTRRALEEDFTHHDPLFDPRVSPAETSLIAIGMANRIDQDKRISDDTHARLHAVLKAELKIYARANAALEAEVQA